MFQVGGKLGGGNPLSGVLALLVALGLSGCPRTEPATSGAQELLGERPDLPVLLLDFNSLEPRHHDYLRTPPSSGLPLAEVETIFSSGQAQRTRTFWGSQRVIQFTDVTRADPGLSPATAWVFGPNRSDGIETIDAVLLRGFSGAPEAPSWDALLTSLSPAWPVAWHLCRPGRSGRSAGEQGPGPDLVAHDLPSGTKLGLSREGDLWTVDHVAFLSTLLDLGGWWAEKGYGDCVSLGSMTSEGSFEPSEEQHDVP